MKNCFGVAAIVTALSGGLGLTHSALACSLVPPGILSRSVWPGSGVPVPTNARLVIHYVSSGPSSFGSDVLLLDADGSPVAAALDVVGTSVVIRPDGSLMPNHGYQIADRRIVPCTDEPQGGCALTDVAQVFASFTTGGGPDTATPLFAGIDALSIASHLACDNDACCGTYETYQVQLSWASASDDVIGTDVRYNVYRRAGSSLTLVAGLVEGTSFTGSRVCSGSWGGIPLDPGDYVVRSVDGSGNEDSNQVTRRLDDPCESSMGCAIQESSPRSGGKPWAALVGLGVVVAVGVWRRRFGHRW